MAKSLLELYGVNNSLIGNKNYESAERNLLKIILGYDDILLNYEKYEDISLSSIRRSLFAKTFLQKQVEAEESLKLVEFFISITNRCVDDFIWHSDEKITELILLEYIMCPNKSLSRKGKQVESYIPLDVQQKQFAKKIMDIFSEKNNQNYFKEVNYQIKYERNRFGVYSFEYYCILRRKIEGKSKLYYSKEVDFYLLDRLCAYSFSDIIFLNIYDAMSYEWEHVSPIIDALSGIHSVYIRNSVTDDVLKYYRCNKKAVLNNINLFLDCINELRRLCNLYEEIYASVFYFHWNYAVPHWAFGKDEKELEKIYKREEISDDNVIRYIEYIRNRNMAKEEKELSESDLGLKKRKSNKDDRYMLKAYSSNSLEDLSETHVGVFEAEQRFQEVLNIIEGVDVSFHIKPDLSAIEYIEIEGERVDIEKELEKYAERNNVEGCASQENTIQDSIIGNMVSGRTLRHSELKKIIKNYNRKEKDIKISSESYKKADFPREGIYTFIHAKTMEYIYKY